MNHILNPTWKGKVKPEVIKDLSKPPDPLIFSSFEDVDIWFRAVERRHIAALLPRACQTDGPEFVSLMDAVGILRDDGDKPLRKLLSDHELQIIRDAVNNGRVETTEDLLPELGSLSSDLPDLYAVGIKPESAKFLHLSPKGRAALYQLASNLFPDHATYRARPRRPLSNEYLLPHPDSQQFLVWEIIHDFGYEGVFESADAWDRIQTVLEPHGMELVVPPTAFENWYAERPRSETPSDAFWEFWAVLESHADCEEEAVKRAQDELMGIFNDFWGGVTDQVNYRCNLLDNRRAFIYGFAFEKYDCDAYHEAVNSLRYMINHRRLRALRHVVNSSLLMAAAFTRIAFNSVEALDPGRRAKGPQRRSPHKEQILPWLLPTHDIMASIGLTGRTGRWSIRFLELLAGQRLWESEQEFWSNLSKLKNQSPRTKSRAKKKRR